MKQITIGTEIHYFDLFEAFIHGFEIGEKDLIFTRKGFLPFFQHLETQPQFLFNDDFGKGEPTDVIIDNILKAVRKLEFNRLIAIGGGSVIDIAKLLVLKDVTTTAELFQKKIPPVKAKELIAIPTTCGTGSEVTNVSITAVEALSTKLGLADGTLFPDYAVLVPELLKDLPYSVIINSSVDALVHGAESFLSPKATPFSRMYSKAAMEIIVGVFSKAAREGKNTVGEHIKDLLFASCYAGLAFGHAGTAVVTPWPILWVRLIM